jgi:hypothetical protein
MGYFEIFLGRKREADEPVAEPWLLIIYDDDPYNVQKYALD